MLLFGSSHVYLQSCNRVARLCVLARLIYSQRSIISQKQFGRAIHIKLNIAFVELRVIAVCITYLLFSLTGMYAVNTAYLSFNDIAYMYACRRGTHVHVFVG